MISYWEDLQFSCQSHHMSHHQSGGPYKGSIVLQVGQCTHVSWPPERELDSALHYTTLPLVSPTLSLWLKYCQMTIPADAIQPLLLPCNCYSAPIQICHCLSAPCQWGPWQWLMSQDQQYTLKTLQNIKSLNVTFWYIILHICWIMILEDTPQLFNS